jgi:cyclophilin family peptidyl-prolyl cis-trans isomerase/HEAT repeat protein
MHACKAPRAAARAAGVGGARGVPALAAALLVLAAAGAATQPMPAAREARARLLAGADARRVDRAMLQRFAGHPDAAVRADVAALIGNLASARGAALLERLAGDSEAAVRAAAAAAAGRLYADLLAGDNARGRLDQVLRRLLGDRDPAVRAAAAWGMGMAPLEHAGRHLVQRLQHESEPAVRAAVLRELWRVTGQDWIGVAAAALTDRDPGVRFAAAWSLARSPEARAAAPLRQAARDPQAPVRVAALAAAARGHGEALWDELCTATDDNDGGVRTAAYAGLAAALDAGVRRRVPVEVAARVAALLRGDDPERLHERVTATRLAGAARIAGAELRRLAGGGGWASAEALAALARSEPREAAPLVQAQLAAAEIAARLAGVRAARWLPDGTQRLIALLDDAAPEVRLAAVDELAASKAPEAVTPLRRRFADDDAVVRAAAVEACAAIGALPRPEVLLEILAKESGASAPDVAAALIAALTQRDALDEATRAALVRLLEGRNPVVARAAWEGLRAHGVEKALPPVATGKAPSYYREVLEWAARPRWLEVVTVRGTLHVRLDGERTPLAAYRLSRLADEKFFDNLTFHRVVTNFVVQGGDPRGDGWGGPGFTLRDELSLAPYDAGAVGLALSGQDTGGSQLFVTLAPQPHLIGRYPRVGEVVAGLDVASRIGRGDAILRVRAGEGAPPPYYPVWYGVLASDRLDAGIAGWREERERYRPDDAALATLATARLRYRVTAAIGTWCADSREQIPRLQAVLAKLGESSPFETPRLVGVDRSKQVPASLFPFGDVELVPTIVVSIEGSEVGRIVETPTSGAIERDLVRILAPIEGWPAEE